MCLFCDVSAISPCVSSWNHLYFVFLMAALRTWGGAPFPNQACLCVVMQGLQKQEIQSPACSILSSLWSAWPLFCLNAHWPIYLHWSLQPLSLQTNLLLFMIQNPNHYDQTLPWLLCMQFQINLQKPFFVVLTLKTENNVKHCTYVSLAPKTKEYGCPARKFRAKLHSMWSWKS